MIRIVEVTDKRQKKQFIDFPHDHFAGDPHYVPELHIAEQDKLNPEKYPFFKYGTAELYLAYKDDKLVGRIAAINNPRYNEHYGTQVGFFGYFNCIDDTEVATALVDKARVYARQHGYTSIMGPTNLTTNDTAGILVDGFDGPPMIMMTYNKPYYPALLESIGMVKEKDLYAFMIYTDKANPKSIRLAKALKDRLARRGITFRNINLKNLKSEAEKIYEIYNEAWLDNWGFVPFTRAEFDFLRDDLKMIADDRFIYFAEKDGEAVGFGLTLPNINEVLQRISRGRLLPTGLLKLLWGRKRTQTVRILALGVKKDHRRQGIEAVFFSQCIEEAQRRGLVGGEASWVLESNKEMIAAAEGLNGELYRTYRIYRDHLDH